MVHFFPFPLVHPWQAFKGNGTQQRSLCVTQDLTLNQVAIQKHSDFRLSSQPATDLSSLQLRYLFDFADRLGSCHQSSSLTPVSARRVGSL